MGGDKVGEASRTIERLTGIPATNRRVREERLTPNEKRKQEARLKRFLALPPELQEGALRYADNIRSAYQAGR